MDGLYRTESEYSAANTGYFTICSLVFGEFLLFNGKIYETNESLNPGIERGDVAVTIDDVKVKAASFFVQAKIIALGISFPMFLYALIMTFMSSSASDIVKWKKVVGNWFISIVFLFFVEYLITSIFSIYDVLMDMLWNARLSLENNNFGSFEILLFTTSVDKFKNTAGFLSFGYGLEFAGLIIAQILFFGKYILRAFGLIALAAISPLIAIIHSFLVMSGKESSVISYWFKTYLSLLLMQPIHALMYLIFMFTLTKIAIDAPLFGLFCLYALFRGEKIINLMLGVNALKVSGKKEKE